MPQVFLHRLRGSFRNYMNLYYIMMSRVLISVGLHVFVDHLASVGLMLHPKWYSYSLTMIINDCKLV